jgi:hypothetical protein
MSVQANQISKGLSKNRVFRKFQTGNKSTNQIMDAQIFKQQIAQSKNKGASE